MENQRRITFISDVLAKMPSDWLRLTTHRLDIYDESQAKTQFLVSFEAFYRQNKADEQALSELPTAYDYIRLGHPLSSVLEWAIAGLHDLPAEQVISFASATMPIMAVLRKNALANQPTSIYYQGSLPKSFDADLIRKVYGYHFELKQVADPTAITRGEGSTVFIAQPENICAFSLSHEVDFFVNIDPALGSVVLINSEDPKSYVSEIQHVRRRESIAMTPASSLVALQALVGQSANEETNGQIAEDKAKVLASIREITGTSTQALVGSSGLSMQYAIMMGLVHEAQEKHPGKAVKFLVPPNCYGGTNDQARRVAACLPNVEVVDLLVDAGNDMVQSLDTLLEQIAQEDAVPFIIVEIPTNPRVEVPNLANLRDTLSKARKTAVGATATAPVFILDQTFCPNTPFLGEGDILASVSAISYVSGSKFPSGGLCTAGYCVANEPAADLMDKIGLHLSLCDNEATNLQYTILAKQLPSMNQRIAEAYQNTRDFVTFIQETLPAAKINFVSEELADQGFTPSVFSLDLPTKGNTDEEREAYKRALNLKLINNMITEIPQESKYCVSYGQLKGCYWTIPATSTQGTTKEGDKDYIARVAVSPALDLDRHKAVFAEFVKEMNAE